MRNKKAITVLVIVIAILSLIASAMGVFSGRGEIAEQNLFLSLHGENITLHGRGIYQNDSVSVATQGIAQDIITIILGIPMLLISLVLARRGSLKGRLLLTGTIGYFLYAYISYTFLSMYNALFLVYVVLMSTSLFAFLLCIMSIDIAALKSCFSPKLPVRFIGGFQLFIAFMLCTMWLGRIVLPLIAGGIPMGLEHYNTLVIQGLDLGIIVPVAALSGIMIIKKKELGYLLSSIIIIKGLTMLTAITSMLIGMINAGIEVSSIEMVVFPLFNLIAIYCLVVLLRNINEKKYVSTERNYSV
jgi:hypothetical protein